MHNDFHLDLDMDIENLGRVGCAMVNPKPFDEYIELRLHGVHSTLAFSQAFMECNGITRRDADNSFFERAKYVEFNPYVTGRLRDRIAEVKPRDLWNTNIAIHEMLSLARDPIAKDATRLNAMKELNIVMSITYVDENGKTKAGRSLEDFYRDESETVATNEPQDSVVEAPANK